MVVACFDQNGDQHLTLCLYLLIVILIRFRMHFSEGDLFNMVFLCAVQVGIYAANVRRQLTTCATHVHIHCAKDAPKVLIMFL